MIMRWLIAAFFVAAFQSVASAQQPAAFDRTSTHDIAACRSAEDQPVCILRALANFPTHSPYAADWRLAGAEDVLRALGEAGVGRVGGQYAHIPYASTRMVYGHLDATDAAVAAAIVADRNGATPAEALQFVRGRVGVETMGGDQGGAGARCMRFNDIWRAYGTEAERAARPRTPRPSLALARAAVEACEAENAPTESAHPQTMARFYMQLDDIDAARRVMARFPGPPILAQLETAVLVRDVDAAIRIAATPMSALEQRWRPRFATLRGEIVSLAVDDGRPEVIAAMARIVVERRDEEGGPLTEISVARALDALMSAGRREQVLRYTQQLDSAGRDTSSVRSIVAASAAVHGWLLLDQSANARELAEFWVPRVAEQFANGGGCGGDRPFCASGAVMEMFTEIGDVERGWAATVRGSAIGYLSTDFARGRGVQYLDVHLAHISSERGRAEFLRMCAELGGWSEPRATWSETCAERLLTLSRNSNEARTLRAATSSALRIAEVRARMGDASRTDRMLEQAFVELARGPNLPLDTRERASLLEIAIFQLERAGRL